MHTKTYPAPGLVGEVWCILGELMMTYNIAILETESFKKWSHCDGHLVESPVTVRVMILMIPRKVISYYPISFGPLP